MGWGLLHHGDQLAVSYRQMLSEGLPIQRELDCLEDVTLESGHTGWSVWKHGGS